MKANKRRLSLCLLLAIVIMIAATIPALAVGSASEPETAETASLQTEQASEDGAISGKALGAAIAVGLAACGGALGMGIAVGKSLEGISRQPEAENKIRTTLMLGLVFIETAIIYALVVTILIIFVL